MYKLVFTALLLSTVTINAQKKPLENQIESAKSKIEQEKERIVSANTALLEDAKNRVALSTEKFKNATELYKQEKARHKAVLVTEKKKIKTLTSEIKRYK